jgi:hypothetical protein
VETTNLWTLKDGKAIHVKGFIDRARALTEAGIQAE